MIASGLRISLRHPALQSYWAAIIVVLVSVNYVIKVRKIIQNKLVSGAV